MIWSRLTLVTIACSVLVLANLPPGEVSFGSQNDKINHVLAFLVISSLSILAFPNTKLSILFIGLVAFNAVIEVTQALFGLGRQPDILDWFVGVCATLFVVAICSQIRMLRANSG